MNGKELRELLAKQREQKFRKHTEARIDAWCQTSAALTGRKKSNEHIKKVAESNTGRKWTDEQRQRLSESQKGKITSEETKQKISNKLKGRIISDEHKQSISAAVSGRKMSDEFKKQVGERCTGAGNPSAKLTEEQVLEIYHSPESNRKLAKKYGVGPTAIGSIKNGKKWASVTGHNSVDKGDK